MAAPTDVRVEANSSISAILNWTYGGSNYVQVYRSTDGVTYNALSGNIAPATTTYTDSTLNAGTKYWYKLTDDSGSTFSSVVTVWSHACLSTGTPDSFALPRFNGEEQQSSELNAMAQRVETTLGNYVLAPGQCVACPSDGAVTIDCSNGCHDWVVVADQDINSIAVQWCDSSAGTINFIVPPNTSGRKICGWPAGFGFGGDECKHAALTSGSSGLVMSVAMGGAQGSQASPSGALSKRGYGPGSAQGGGGGGGGCSCVPGQQGELTIKCCSSGCSLNCSSTKSLKLMACGGRAPYTWSKTGNVQLQNTTQTSPASTSSGTAITVTPPANTGSGTAGTAYHKYGGRCDNGFGVETTCPGSVFNVFDSSYGCNDQSLASCGSVGSFARTGNCVSAPVNVGAADCATVTPCYDGSTCTYGTCDSRSGAMIAAGCVPCGVNAGATVSVTDAVGTVVTIILGS